MRVYRPAASGDFKKKPYTVATTVQGFVRGKALCF
jgi:hypothetical protein